MNSFNIIRFGNVLRRLCIVRRKKIISLTLGLTIFFALTGIMSIDPFHIGPIDKTEIMIRFLGVLGMIVIVFSTFLTIGGYLIISDLNNKNSLIDELTLPASVLEKFVARLLFVTIGVMLSLAVSFLVADVIQQLLCMLLHAGTRVSMLGFILDSYPGIRNGFGSLSIYFIAYLFQNSIFVLGGVFFKKVPWLCTIIVLFLLFTIISLAIIGLVSYIYGYTNYHLSLPDIQVCTPLKFLIGAVFTGLNYFLAYRLFCRLQVINNRWFNI